MRITATWSMSIPVDDLIKEMLDTGEYGLNAHPITDTAIIEFFRNWAFGLDPNTYQDEWAHNPACDYGLDISDSDDNQLWYKHFLSTKETNNA